MQREGKQPVRQHMSTPQRYPPGAQRQPYYAYPTPERTMPGGNSVANTPSFGVSAVLTPNSTLSPQTTWQSPQPGMMPQNEFGPWSDFDFNNLRQSLPPTSEPLTMTQGCRDSGAMPTLNVASRSKCSSHGNISPEQDFSPFKPMPYLGIDGQSGLEGVLQQDLDEYAGVTVY